MEEIKRLNLRLSKNDYDLIHKQAEETGRSMNEYICEAALHAQIINSLPEAKLRGLVASLYTLAKQEEMPVRKEIQEVADMLWRYLK